MHPIHPLTERSEEHSAPSMGEELVEYNVSGLLRGARRRSSGDEDVLLALTSEIVAAHMSRNPVEPEEISNVINQVYNALQAIHKQEKTHVLPQKPAVSIEDSITPDYIICLEDGKKLKMLKRHLRAAYNMSVEEYRRRWGLPADYPMVAPNYAKQRSRLAKTIGLGMSRKSER